jgi:hypothetical protein
LLREDFGGEGARRRLGLDCFYVFLARVFSANFKGHIVFSFLFKVLLVKLALPTII